MSAARPCPVCGKPSLREHRPFCSQRCARIDLGRWLGEEYRLPAEDDAEDGEDAPPGRP